MSDSELKIESSQQNDIVIIKISGSLDAKTSPDFDKYIRDLIGKGKVKFVCDMKDLKFIASAGLGILSALRKQLKSSGGDIRISRPAPAVLDVFELLSFSKLFVIEHSLDETLKGF